METSSPLHGHASALESHLGYWLRRVSNAVSGEFARGLQAKQTSVAEWVLLRELYERKQATPSEFAEALGMTRGAVSKIVDKLEAKMWVQTRAEVGDSRFRQICLTREGRRIVPVLAKIADQNDAHFFGWLDAGERRVLRQLLVKLAEHHQLHAVPME